MEVVAQHTSLETAPTKSLNFGGSQNKKTPPAQKKDSATSTGEDRCQEEDTTTQNGPEQD